MSIERIKQIDFFFWIFQGPWGGDSHSVRVSAIVYLKVLVRVF